MYILTGRHVGIRWLEEEDADSLLDLHVRNRAFFQIYTPLREESFYTRAGQLEQIKMSKERREVDEQYLCGIVALDSGVLVGCVSLSEVLRGPLQSCFIGYYLDQAHNGKGYATEAVRLLVDHAFGTLKLHRIEAGVMPHNGRSIRVLEKAGFHKEGIARKNVRINGLWEDHQVLAILNDDMV